MSPETESKTETQYKPFAFDPNELRNYTAELNEEIQHVIGELSREEANMRSAKVKHEALKGHPMTLIETLKDVAFFTGQAQKTLSAFLQAPELPDGYSVEKEAQLRRRSFDRENRTDNRFRTIRYSENHAGLDNASKETAEESEETNIYNVAGTVSYKQKYTYFDKPDEHGHVMTITTYRVKNKQDS